MIGGESLYGDSEVQEHTWARIHNVGDQSKRE